MWKEYKEGWATNHRKLTPEEEVLVKTLLTKRAELSLRLKEAENALQQVKDSLLEFENRVNSLDLHNVFVDEGDAHCVTRRFILTGKSVVI